MYPFARDLKLLVIPEALSVFPQRMRSPAAVELLLMTAAHESGFRNLRQDIGGGRYGPARGLFQQEPISFDDIWDRAAKLCEAACPSGYPGVDRLMSDLQLAVRMARIHYWLVPAPLPEAEDIDGLARYAKLFWNTPSGAATEADYKEAYLRLCV